MIKAAQIIYEEKIGIPILLGNKEKIKNLMESIDFEADVSIIDPKTEEHTKSRQFYANAFWETQKEEEKPFMNVKVCLKKEIILLP